MPLLDHTRLEGHRQWRLAHIWLQFAVSAYIKQDGPMKMPRVDICCYLNNVGTISSSIDFMIWYCLKN